MPFCKKCGVSISPEARFCPECGFDQNSTASTTDSAPRAAASSDTGSFGWAVLGFLIPIAGLILWLVWKDEQPKNAHMAGKGALVSVLVCVAFYALIFIIAIAAAIAGI